MKKIYISNKLELKNASAELYYNKLISWIKNKGYKIEETEKPIYIKVRFFFPFGNSGRSAIINLEEKQDRLFLSFSIPQPKIYDGSLSLYKPIELYKLLLQIYESLGVSRKEGIINIYSKEIIDYCLMESRKRINYMWLFFILTFLVFFIFIISYQFKPIVFLVVIIPLFYSIYLENTTEYNELVEIKTTISQ